MISILNFGMGNIRSVKNALDFLGIKFRVIEAPGQVLESEKLILPGVGSFRLAMENIKKRNLLNAMNVVALEKSIPILGICLGMQLLAEGGEEDSLTNGLGWIQGSVKRFQAEPLSIKVPHVGFNTVYFEKRSNTLFKDLGSQSDFYFVHSYRMLCKNDEDVSGWTEYGERFASSVQKDNIFGTQFHPEKSQSNGLIVLRNFGNLKGVI